MPIYDYRCRDCGRASSHFFRSFAHVSDPVCPSCGSAKMVRMVSKFAIVKGNLRRTEDIDAGRDLADLDPMNPASVARWAKRMGQERDPELGSNLREMAERIEAGDTPSELYDPAYYYRYAVEHHKEEVASAGREQEPPRLEDQMGRPELKDVGLEP